MIIYLYTSIWRYTPFYTLLPSSVVYYTLLTSYAFTRHADAMLTLYKHIDPISPPVPHKNKQSSISDLLIQLVWSHTLKIMCWRIPLCLVYLSHTNWINANNDTQTTCQKHSEVVSVCSLKIEWKIPWLYAFSLVTPKVLDT